jgi:hypothetical protein
MLFPALSMDIIPAGIFSRVALFASCLALLACSSPNPPDAIRGNGEIGTFLNVFFQPGSILTRESSAAFAAGGQVVENLSIGDAPDNCNQSKSHCLAYLPGFEIVAENGRKVVQRQEPDDFVDLLDLSAKTVQRVASMGTPGTIYGTCWLTGSAFAVYGVEGQAGFVNVFDIKEQTLTRYSVDKRFALAGASQNDFLIAKYGAGTVQTLR